MEEKICSLCMEIITNPVCPECYLRHIDSWLKHMSINPVLNEIIISKIKEKTNFETQSNERCIFCNNENISLCSYCFFTLSVKSLIELNMPNELIQVFEAQFNYCEENSSLQL